MLPDWLVGKFTKQIGQFKEGLTENDRFTRNFNSKSSNRAQNVRERQVYTLASTSSEQLGRDNSKKSTKKSFRQLADAQLVESGASIADLCEAGN